MPRWISVFIVIVCVVLISSFMIFRLQTGANNTLSSEDFNESNEKSTDSSYVNEVNKEITGSEDPIVPGPKTADSEQIDEEKDVVECKYQRGEFQAGISLVLYEHPNIANAQKLFKHLRELGINSVAIVYPFFQADWQADQVNIDPEITPDIAELKALILSAHAEDLSVMLRPILDENSIMTSGHWRGEIKPKKPETWFDSYRSLLLTYAELAQETNAEVFSIGTELNSLQVNSYSGEWLRIIKEVREVYEGKLIYAFNWDCYSKIPSIEFVSELDYVGIDAYFPLDAPNGASAEDLEKAWEEWMGKMKKVFKDESIVLTEVGMLPVAGAYRNPYVWSMPGKKIDYQAQANYYKATFNAWQPMMKGIYWWSISVSEPDPNVIGYSPLGTPTEEVLKQLFLKNPTEGSED